MMGTAIALILASAAATQSWTTARGQGGSVSGVAKRGANLPVADGSFASSTFEQDNKATISQGTLMVGVPDANDTINRDVDAAQVVTKDSLPPTSGQAMLQADISPSGEM